MPEREGGVLEAAGTNQRSLRVPTGGLSFFATGTQFSGCGPPSSSSHCTRELVRNADSREFLGSPVVRTPMLSLLKAWVCSLVGELKSTNHAVQAKKKKKDSRPLPQTNTIRNSIESGPSHLGFNKPPDESEAHLGLTSDLVGGGTPL